MPGIPNCVSSILSGIHRNVYLLRSAGPDEQFDTADDLVTALQVRTSKVMARPTAGTVEIRYRA